MAVQIPFAKLGIPQALEKQLGPRAPRKTKYALARGVVPLTVDVQLAVLYLLANDEHPKIKAAAHKTLKGLPVQMVAKFISLKTHPKVLEFLVEFREPAPAIDERIGMLRVANDRTVNLIARRAHGTLCEMLSRNHERLLIDPQVFVSLHANPNCSDSVLNAAESFLRMQKQLPEYPAVRPFRQVKEPPKPAPAPAPKKTGPLAQTPVGAPPKVDAATQRQMDLEAEIEAALRGEQSPTLLKAQAENLKMFSLDAEQGSQDAEEELGGFVFDFKDDAEAFSWNLTNEDDTSEKEDDQRVSMEVKIREMTVGQRIKLAYLGNKEARSILIRDSNKIVSTAVVKSGRCTDQEVASIAGNKNLDAEVMRVVATNAEWTRKYPVKVALVSNPKCPIPTALTFVSVLHKKDLQALTRNRGVSSVVNQAAQRLFRKKYRK